MADYKRVICKDCHEDRIHWAHGQCHRCYMKQYRKDHGIDGIANIKEKAYENMAEAINTLLAQWGGRCEYRGGMVSVTFQDERKRKEL